MDGSPPKNGFPSSSTCRTVSPFDLTVPLITATPGIFWIRSSAVASVFTLTACAAYSVVSAFWIAVGGDPLTTMPSPGTGAGSIQSAPAS
jgi:hypothetical protein